MLKKTIKIGAIVLAVVLVDRFAFGGAGWNLATGWMADARESIGEYARQREENRPPEERLGKAERMIDELTPVIHENKHRIATEEVEVDKLGERIDRLAARLDQERAEIMVLKKHAEGSEQFVSFGGKAFTKEQVKLDLTRRFERYQTADDSLRHLRKVHDARQKSLDATQQKLENMLAARQQLVEEVANLKARLEMVRAAQAVSQAHFDDSQLAKVREYVDALDTKIKVMAKLADQEADAYPEIPIDEVAPENILEQVEAYFSPAEEHIVLGE